MEKSKGSHNENRTERVVRKKKRRKKRYLLRFLIFIVFCVGIYFLLHIDYFAINGIAVAGNKEISDEEIIDISQLKTGENIFDIHPWFTERRIKKNLYVEDVNVKRKLPNKIEIIINERNGKAQLASGKKYVITDNDGMVLEITKEEKKITLVENITVKKAGLEKTIEVKEQDAWKKSVKIIKLAEENDLYFKSIRLDSSKVEAHVYDGLVCKGRYDNLVECIESGALKSVIFDLYQKGIESGIINIGSNNYCSFTH